MAPPSSGGGASHAGTAYTHYSIERPLYPSLVMHGSPKVPWSRELLDWRAVWGRSREKRRNCNALSRNCYLMFMFLEPSDRYQTLVAPT